MKKQLMIALVGVCASAFADFSASDYVQDGLVTQFDAIDNVGAGTHQADATEWVDLIGGARFTLQDHGSWSGGKALVCDGAGLAAISDTRLMTGMTYEYTCKRAIKSTTANELVFFGGLGGAYGPYGGWQKNSDYLLYSHYKGLKVAVGQFAVASCLYALDPDTGNVSNGTSARLNGINADKVGSNNLNAGANKSLIGAKADGTWPFKGDVYSIRIYSRELTEPEAVWNSGLDRVRFNGEDPSVAFSPVDGYSYSDGAFRVATRLFTGGGGTVGVKDDTSAKDHTVALAYKVPVTIVATPAEGYVFDGWIGPGISADKITSSEVTIPADRLASYEAVFKLSGGTPWWTAGTMVWDRDTWEQMSWFDPTCWLDSTAKTHRQVTADDKVDFNKVIAYNVLVPAGATVDVKSLKLQGGGADGVNTLTIGQGAAFTSAAELSISPANSTGWRRHRLVLDGSTFSATKATLPENPTVSAELIITNGASMTITSGSGMTLAASSGSYYGGTGSVQIVNGSLSLPKGPLKMSNAINTEADSNASRSFTTLRLGPNGHLTATSWNIGRNAEVLIDGGEFDFQGMATTGPLTPYVRFFSTASCKQRIRMTDGIIRYPSKPTGGTGHYGNERQSHIEFIGAGDTSFVQSGGIVTNYGIWFRQASGTVPPRYEISGGTMFMGTGNHQGDVAAGHPNGECANGLAVFHDCPNSGTFSVKGGTAKVSIPRVLTTVFTDSTSDDNGTNKTYAETPYRPHIETVITKTGTTAIELRNSTEVHGMHTVIPEGGLQVVTTNRFAVWRQAAGETLTQPSETYYRPPNAALWNAGVFADNPSEWGVTLKDAAQIVPGADLGSGVAAGWMELPTTGTNCLRSARILLKLAPQEGFALADVVADMKAAGLEAAEIAGDYNVAVDVKSILGERAKAKRLVFDFNAVQNAIEVRDQVLTPKALLLKAKDEYVSCGLVIMVR